MEFSLEDIVLLYGEEMYILPDYAPQHEEVPSIQPPAVAVQPQVQPTDAISAVASISPEKITIPAQPVAPVAEVQKPVAEPVERPSTPPVVAPSVAPASKVTWKLRPTSRFALVMTEAEFGRKLLTSALRVFVESAKIPLEQTGFGVIPDGSTNWQLADAPVQTVVMLTPRPAGWQTPPNKTVLFADLLTAVVADPAKEQQLAAMMQEVLRGLA